LKSSRNKPNHPTTIDIKRKEKIQKKIHKAHPSQFLTIVTGTIAFGKQKKTSSVKNVHVGIKSFANLIFY